MKLTIDIDDRKIKKYLSDVLDYTLYDGYHKADLRKARVPAKRILIEQLLKDASFKMWLEDYVMDSVEDTLERYKNEDSQCDTIDNYWRELEFLDEARYGEPHSSI